MARWLERERNLRRKVDINVLSGWVGVESAIESEVKALCRRDGVMLIVVRDCDEQSPAQCYERLERRLGELDGAQRNRIALVHPSFNIESWIDHALNGATKDWTGDPQMDRAARDELKEKLKRHPANTEACPKVSDMLEVYYQNIKQTGSADDACGGSLRDSARELCRLNFDQQ
jgi:hypothetical protein